MTLRLPKLQKSNLEAKKLRKTLPKGWKDIKDVFYYQSLLYVAEIIYLKIIHCHYNNSLADHFKIKKVKKLIAKKYY